jgi:hypothetical protein
MLRTRFFRLLLASLCITSLSAVCNGRVAHSSTLPAEAGATVSAAIGRDVRGYHAQAVRGGLRFENTRHDIAADFDAGGVDIRSGSARWRMHLLAFGRKNAMTTSANVAPRGRLNRIEYRHGAITEWYVNGPLGLEQGFTVTGQPTGIGNQPLTVALGISGNLAALAAREDGLTFIRRDGAAVLRYEGLTAYDAAGRELRCWLELSDRELVLKVDDSAAHYPVTIDPWIQRAALTASDGQSGDALGSSIAISGDTVAVGSPLSGSATQGAVYVFVKPASGWKNMTQVAKLTATDADFEDELGLAVDIAGDTIVAGAPVVGFNDKPGAVYVFVKPADGWKDMTQTAELLASDGQPGDQLGWFVSMSGNTVVGGAISAGSSSAGVVYVFTKPTSSWKKRMTQTAELSASHGGAVGGWLSIDRDTVVSGGVSGINGKEAALVYVKPSKGWKKTMTETAILEASDGQPLDGFGNSTYIEGDTIAVGAPEAKIGSNIEQGAGYVFVKPARGWKGLLTQTAKLTSSDGRAKDQLGWSVSISGNILALGANDAHAKESRPGAAYIYVKPAAGWKNATQKSKVIARDGMLVGEFGASVSMSGGTLAVGAPGTTVGSKIGQGAAFVFGSVK